MRRSSTLYMVAFVYAGVFSFFPLCFFSLFLREEGRSVVKASLLLPYVQRQDHRHSCAAEAITEKKQKEGDDMKRQEERQRKKVTVKPLSLLPVSKFCQGSQPIWTVERKREPPNPNSEPPRQNRDHPPSQQPFPPSSLLQSS